MSVNALAKRIVAKLESSAPGVLFQVRFDSRKQDVSIGKAATVLAAQFEAQRPECIVGYYTGDVGLADVVSDLRFVGAR